MKDSQELINIYRKYLEITGDLVTVLEKNFKKLESDSKEAKKKRNAFIKHAHGTINCFHEDIHKLFKIGWELKELEK